MSDYAELFVGNSDVDVVVPEDVRYERLARRLHRRFVSLGYSTHFENGQTPPPHHVISCFCRCAGIKGLVALRPYLFLGKDERKAGRLVPRQIAIQSSGLGARYHIANKEWYAERFQAVVSALKSKYSFVQIGSHLDPAVAGVLDLRGKTRIRETAAILAESLVFVGLAGFLMHLARTVECRSVIVYGGRELPSQTGYTCNENLCSRLDCSPCWQHANCRHDRECMKMIEAGAVVEAIERQVERFGTPLPLDTDWIS